MCRYTKPPPIWLRAEPIFLATNVLRNERAPSSEPPAERPPRCAAALRRHAGTCRQSPRCCGHRPASADSGAPAARCGRRSPSTTLRSSRPRITRTWPWRWSIRTSRSPSARTTSLRFAPHVIRDGPPQYWDLKLEEALKLALMNSPVLRDLGGQVLVNPQIVRHDSRSGHHRNRSELSASRRRCRNSMPICRPRAIGRIITAHQQLVLRRWHASVPTGLESVPGSDHRSAPPPAVSTSCDRTRSTTRTTRRPTCSRTAWDTNIEAEVRQPLLQGAGVLYNRIAGPNGTIGQANGVLIARVNTDISLAEFEAGRAQSDQQRRERLLGLVLRLSRLARQDRRPR